MLTAKVPRFTGDYSVFQAWSRILRDRSGKFSGIKEMKDASGEELTITEVNPGIYLFDAVWLWDHLPELKNTNASGEYYLTDLLKMAVEEGEDIRTTLTDAFGVIGVNTPEELARAEQLLGK
jgi:bifunctional N-acetylglucosamine-1-phosphate-uridyltransferase/glucosamine-1-phosphate-acetyltransferase GlmU-like protein